MVSWERLVLKERHGWRKGGREEGSSCMNPKNTTRRENVRTNSDVLLSHKGSL